MTGNDILYLVIPCYNEEAVLPETARQLLEKMNSMFERGMISRESRIKTGKIALQSGISGSVIGCAASSESNKVITSSDNCNSPICRFPISRMARIKKR